MEYEEFRFSGEGKRHFTLSEDSISVTEKWWIVNGSYLTGGTLDRFSPESPWINVLGSRVLSILGTNRCRGETGG